MSNWHLPTHMLKHVMQKCNTVEFPEFKYILISIKGRQTVKLESRQEMQN